MTSQNQTCCKLTCYLGRYSVEILKVSIDLTLSPEVDGYSGSPTFPQIKKTENSSITKLWMKLFKRDPLEMKQTGLGEPENAEVNVKIVEVSERKIILILTLCEFVVAYRPSLSGKSSSTYYCEH
ncbi:hypothetical protein AVEN_81998-1 [Araneus ventricosus]|uniref:Uncharacterized protein n=1 Tax=Araneus ventricosus TaxID=182803 RepID=A0A4Y2IZA5_ARAVE|nr:hypothetical protein AVEN_81998-1 [Araneus ventricosus]